MIQTIKIVMQKIQDMVKQKVHDELKNINIPQIENLRRHRRERTLTNSKVKQRRL
jgi:broad specificity polyphosphatase/5'/3'-nucleotidase SurE